MRRALPLAAFLLLPLAAFAGPGDGDKEDKDKPKKEVTCTGQVGFGGWYRVGGWTPVFVRVDNTTDDDYSLKVSASVDYGEGGANAAFSRDLELPHGGRKQVVLYVRTIQPAEEIKVQCRSARTGVPVCAAALGAHALGAGRVLLLVTGPSALSGLKAHSTRDAAVEVKGGELPDLPEGYDGTDWVVLRGAEWAGDAARLEALTQWLESGGRAAVAGGEALHALAASPLGKRLGLTLRAPVPVEGIRGLQQLAGDSLSLPTAGGLLCERPDCRGAEAVASSGETPLMVRAGLGAGELLLFGVDPEVFRGQPGYWGLWQHALGLPAPGKEGDENPAAFLNEPKGLPWVEAIGSSGLYHTDPLQLNWLWPFLVVYLCVVAPLDYLLVRRLRRWRLAGLLTLSFWAVSACAACYALGSSGRFMVTRMSRVAVLDVFPIQGGEGRAAGRALTSFYNSTNSLFDVGPPWGRGSAAVVVDPERMQKLGMLTNESLSWEEDAQGLRLVEAPIYVGNQKVFESRWWGGLKELGVVLIPSGKGGWRLENHAQGTLVPLSGGRSIPAGGAVDLGSPGAFPDPASGNALQTLLAGWLGSRAPAGMPLRFSCRSQRGYAFWVVGETVPLGLAKAHVDKKDEAVLLRIHAD